MFRKPLLRAAALLQRSAAVQHYNAPRAMSAHSTETDEQFDTR